MDDSNKFNIKKFIQDIFAPAVNEVMTIMVDIPHKTVKDNKKWVERREMASRWHKMISSIAEEEWGMKVNGIVTYNATGNNNSDLPELCMMNDREMKISNVVKNSTIILSMPEFSATAPLYEYSLKEKRLRIGSMPGVEEFMENTGLSADYEKISKKCHILFEIFKESAGAYVEFSIGHRCYFDIGTNRAMIDDGILHPEMGGTEQSLANLPSGEVFVVPNEEGESLTKGDLPFYMNKELAVCKVEKNKIVAIEGSGKEINDLRKSFENDAAWRNIAEFAIGVNDKAVVTGNVLQDEKAGFHWAYGRSDHLGGNTGVKNFISPSNVVHQDTVYAKGNMIECSRLVMKLKNGKEREIIKDGKLLV